MEMVEEFGEFAGCLKRLRRLELKTRTDPKGHDAHQLRIAMLQELGDMGVCLANIANSVDANLGDAITLKFNMTSRKYEFDIFIE